MPDAHANLTLTTVATAPSPATSGTSLVVAAGAGANFPAVPFNATIWPTAASPTKANAEIVRVTAISTDTLTITRAQESTTARTVVVGDQIAATITAKTLTDVETPSNGLAPSDALYETFPRHATRMDQASPGLVSGTLYLCGIKLPSGLSIGHINFYSSATAAVSMTHWWFGLYDSSRVQLATTADQTTAAWAANAKKSLAIATVSGGAASSFTTTYTGPHYLGIMLATSNTLPSLLAVNFSGGTAAAGDTPIVEGNADTGKTTPPAFPFTATALTVQGFNLYGTVAA